MELASCQHDGKSCGLGAARGSGWTADSGQRAAGSECKEALKWGCQYLTQKGGGAAWLRELCAEPRPQQCIAQGAGSNGWGTGAPAATRVTYEALTRGAENHEIRFKGRTLTIQKREWKVQKKKKKASCRMC